MRSFGSRFVTVEIERENGLILKLYFPLSALGLHTGKHVLNRPRPPVSLGPPAHLRFAAFFSRLRPSAARRFAVRLSAATFAAFLARAVRSSGVMFFAAVLPPSLPN